MKMLSVFMILFCFIFCFSSNAEADTFKCPAMGAPTIKVITKAAQPQFDFSMTQQALDDKFSSSTLPAPEVYHLEVNSVMTGSLTAAHKSHMRQFTDAKTGQTCIGLDKIDVTMTIIPRIYMASEFRKKECQYAAFFTHEMKHLETDKILMLEYKPRMRDALKLALAMPGDIIIGPVTGPDIEAAQNTLHARVQSAIDGIYTLMMQERLNRQKKIDSFGEYAGLSNAC